MRAQLTGLGSLRFRKEIWILPFESKFGHFESVFAFPLCQDNCCPPRKTVDGNSLGEVKEPYALDLSPPLHPHRGGGSAECLPSRVVTVSGACAWVLKDCGARPYRDTLDPDRACADLLWPSLSHCNDELSLSATWAEGNRKRVHCYPGRQEDCGTSRSRLR